MNPEALRSDHRHIRERIIIQGMLVLDTPTCLGSGDADSPTDLALLRDSVSNRALLTGSSIAGALRNYLREYEKGYSGAEQKEDWATYLFGGMRGDKDGAQSSLIIDDAISTTINIELRDGVKIESKTGTAADQGKYDLELLTAGTKFPLCFELLIESGQDRTQLIQTLALALRGLEKREIGIGTKKRRGFGRCHVEKWKVRQFDLHKADEQSAWLLFDHWTEFAENNATHTSIIKALAVSLDELKMPDRRSHLTLYAIFELDGSLLIRSGQASTSRSPDVVHLRSKRGNDMQPVLSGTSLAGVLRHRAERIVNTLKLELKKPTEIVNQLFGFVSDNDEEDQSQSSVESSQKKKDNAKASRLVVHETQITNTADLVQSRIAIDRFTGGALHGALFDEQPVFGKKDETSIEIRLELREPKHHEIGLLLLLLKDLWTSDLPVGGGSSIGRGRLKGKTATIIHHTSEPDKKWTITKNDKHLEISDAAALEKFVKALTTYLEGEKAA